MAMIQDQVADVDAVINGLLEKDKRFDECLKGIGQSRERAASAIAAAEIRLAAAGR